MYKITDMKCPECKAATWIFKLSDVTYRIECSRLSCDYVDEFEYREPKRVSAHRVINRVVAFN